MNVGNLIHKLSKYPSDMEVVRYDGDIGYTGFYDSDFDVKDIIVEEQVGSFIHRKCLILD